MDQSVAIQETLAKGEDCVIVSFTICIRLLISVWTLLLLEVLRVTSAISQSAMVYNLQIYNHGFLI